MNAHEDRCFRLGLLRELVVRAKATLRRTSIMKLAYLLQTVKDVPLGYDFRLYTYGPFDSDVLNDLSLAESLGLLKSQMVVFPSGYGYEFAAGPFLNKTLEKVRDKLAPYDAQVDWALQEFGCYGAADLELMTTIIYADRESARHGKWVLAQELGRKVKEVKPHFSVCYIAMKIRELANKGLLKATRDAPPC